MTSSDPEYIGRLVAQTPLLLMLDIDGTLCDIVPESGDARVPEATREVLQRLARRVDVHVAFVTGRSLRDARRMVRVDGTHIHANHGVEIAHPDGTVEIEDGWSAAAPFMRAATAELAVALGAFPRSLLEEKEYSLTVHHRGIDRSLEAELVAAVSEIAARHGVRMEGGKCVLNIVPDIGVDKGTAVMRLVTELFGSETTGAVLFAGDDVTDEHAFRALARVPGAVTVKVGERSVPTAAKFTLPDPSAVHTMLAAIEEQLA